MSEGQLLQRYKHKEYEPPNLELSREMRPIPGHGCKGSITFNNKSTRLGETKSKLFAQQCAHLSHATGTNTYVHLRVYTSKQCCKQ